MTGPANRGKYAEGKVRDFLKLLEGKHASFTFNRVQDAHSAGGRFAAQAGDFQAFLAFDPKPISATHQITHYLWASRNFIIEVKEFKHDFRLPHASYSADKVARVQKRVLAGTEAIVILYHSEARLWRAVPFSVFTDRSGASWDLRAWPAVDYKLALTEFFGIAT